MKMNCELIMTASQMKQGRADWLKLRNESIGGSDASVIIGANPWKSRLELWMEKTGQKEAKDISRIEPVYWGTKIEPLVANRFTEETGKKVRRCGLYRSIEYPWATGSFDRLIVGEDAGLEIKTTSAFNRKAWEGENIPIAYYVQCQHYMMVSGLPRWYIACLIGNTDFVWKTIERDEDDIHALKQVESDFWHQVKDKVAPEPDGSESATEALRERFSGGKTERILLPDSASVFIKDLDKLKDFEKSIKAQKREIQNKLCAMLGDYEVGIVCEGDDTREVKWATVAGRKTLDSKRLKAERPDIYEAYIKIGKPTRRFSI
jgi:putative phage-type endonuclease